MHLLTHLFSNVFKSKVVKKEPTHQNKNQAHKKPNLYVFVSNPMSASLLMFLFQGTVALSALKI